MLYAMELKFSEYVENDYYDNAILYLDGPPTPEEKLREIVRACLVDLRAALLKVDAEKRAAHDSTHYEYSGLRPGKACDIVYDLLATGLPARGFTLVTPIHVDIGPTGYPVAGEEVSESLRDVPGMPRSESAECVVTMSVRLPDEAADQTPP